MIDELVERDADWNTIKEQYRRVRRQGTSRLVLLTGPGGIGKTVLLDAFVASIPAGPILRARAAEFEGGTPYGLLKHGVHTLARQTDDPLLAEAATTFAAGLAESAGAPVPDANLHAQLRALLRALGSDRRPAVVVLDDLHDADADTAAVIARLLHSTMGPPVFILAASRLTGVSGSISGPLAGLLERGNADGLSLHLELAPLTVAGVTALGQRIVGRAPTQLLADYVYRATGGVPFHASRLYQELLRQDHIALGERADLSPRSLAAFVDQATTMSGGLPRLTAVQHQVARSLAVLGRCRSAELHLLMDLAQLPESEARLGLLALTDAGLIVDSRDGWCEFAHPILRSIVYSQMPRVTCARLHDRAAALLRAHVRTSGGRGAVDPFAYAIHIDRGVAATQEQRRAAAVTAAHAAMMTAPLAAEHWFGKAADTLPVGDPDRARLLSLRAQSCLLGTDSTEGIRIGLQAIAEAGPGVYRDEMVFLTAFGLFFADRVEEAVELGMGELERHPSNRASEVARFSLLYQLQLSEEAARSFDSAMAAAYSECSNTTVRAASLGQLYLYADLCELAPVRDQLATDVRSVLAKMPPMLAAEVYDALGLQIGSYPGALRQAADDLQVADELRGRRHEMSAWGFSELSVATVSWFQGRWTETLEAIETAVWADEIGGNVLTAQILRSIGVIVLTARGQREKALQLGAGIREDLPVIARAVSVWARSRLMADDAAVAVLTTQLEEHLQHGYFYLAGAIGDELYRRARGRPDARQVAVRLLEQTLDRTNSPLNRMWLLRALGVHRRDPEMLAQALQHATEEGVPFERARILLALSRLSLDPQPAVAAAELFGALGAEPWQAAAARQCRELGLRVHVPRKAVTGLTDSERTIVRLVADGHSNRELAEQLNYSVKRIEAILTGVFRKTGVRSRYQLIAQYRDDPARFDTETV